MGAGERIKEFASRAEAAVDSARASLGSSLANADIPNKLERIARSSREILGKLSLPVGELRANVAQEQGSREIQQDAVAFIELPGSPPRAVAVVADGIGGLESGELASALAVSAFCNEVRKLDSVSSESLRLALFAANDAVFSQHRRMGTTLTACAVDNGTLRWISVGDSRAYLASSGAVSQLTVDHVEGGDRLATRMWEAGQQGAAGVLSSFLGSDEIPLISEGEHRSKLRAGESVVICTDGVHGVIDLRNELVKSALTAEKLAAALMDEVLTREAPRQDNATVLVLSVETPSPVSLLKSISLPAGARRIALSELKLNGRLLCGVAALLLMIVIWWAVKNQNERLGIKSKAGHGESTPSKPNEPKESASEASDLTQSKLIESQAVQSSAPREKTVEGAPSAEGELSSLSEASTSAAGSEVGPAASLSLSLERTTAELSSNSYVSAEDAAPTEPISSLALLEASSFSVESDSATSLPSEALDPMRGDSTTVVSESSFAMSASSLPDSIATDPFGTTSEDGAQEMSSSSTRVYAQNSEIPNTPAPKRRVVRSPSVSEPNDHTTQPNTDAGPSLNIHLNFQELLRYLPRFPIPNRHPRQPQPVRR